MNGMCKAPLVEGINMSFGQYSDTPCVDSVEYKRNLVDNEIDVRHIPQFSAFMHVPASSIHLQISISLSPRFNT